MKILKRIYWSWWTLFYICCGLIGWVIGSSIAGDWEITGFYGCIILGGLFAPPVYYICKGHRE